MSISAKTQPASIEWRDGQPYATQFQDVYFSTENGLAETEYVFIEGNQLADRFRQLNTQTFTIIETGFGTGLNFLCAARLWMDTAPSNYTLHYLSVEKFPLTLKDLESALRFWPELKIYSEALSMHYPQVLSGSTTLLFNNRIHLTLLIGDACEQLSALKTKADAWFLDGFAPAKNPEMWQADLFMHMAKLSKNNTTFATFTSAGDVRRRLQDAGFQVKKRSGFGKKREMLVGHFVGVTT